MTSPTSVTPIPSCLSAKNPPTTDETKEQTEQTRGRMPACEACYNAKVRCDQQEPCCGRCTSRNLTCVPRVSRQGQGPKKRRRNQDDEATKTTDDGQEHRPRAASAASSVNNRSEDQGVVQTVQNLGQHHFGVRYLIHSWISFAFTRRSFGLLGRAR